MKKTTQLRKHHNCIWPQHDQFKQENPEIISNLKRYWFFPVSAMAFFCLYLAPTTGRLVGILFSFIASLVITSQLSLIIDYVKNVSIKLKIISLLTAQGICWRGYTSFNAHWTFITIYPKIICALNAAIAVYFIYLCVLVFWREMLRIISEHHIFSDMIFAEQIVYSILIIASLTLVVSSFLQTEAFYGTEYYYDIIYTSDSTALIKGNCYLVITNPQNDLRQPLFAVFAAPFIGIPYLVGRVIGASASVEAILLDVAQVILMFVANFMLAKLMKLNSVKRICFMLLVSCTYTHLLFTLMIEQYIIAYFWLVFCMYLISEKQHLNRIAMWGAGGTLLTSMILLPFMSDKSPIRNFKTWFTDMVKYGVEFVAVMLAFCRYEVIFNLNKNVLELSEFAGQKVAWIDKIYQYIAFIANIFIAPDAGANTTAVNHISWQLNPITNINIIGVAILLLVVTSAILNRDKRSSLLAAGWVAFSVVILFGMGWGTKENGLILYSLYFGWAFLVLLFQLVEKIEDKLSVKFLIPTYSIGCVVVLSAVNIPAIIKMVNFAITYFPV